MAKKPIAKPKAPARTVNIFDVLKHIDLHKEDYYDNLTETDQKQLHPLVMTRWLSGTSDPAVIQMLNGTVNRYNFSLAPHKPLLMRMLLLVSSGRSRRYQWMGRSKETSTSKFIKVLRQFYQCSEREAAGYVQMHTVAEMAEIARHLGWQEDEIKPLLK